MSRELEYLPIADQLDEEQAPARPPLAPGKRTATQRLVQRRAAGAGRTAPSAQRALDRADGSSGTAPDAGVRAKVEATTGADLSDVRVHTGAASQEAAASVQAKAYTTGRDIHFAGGQYDPGSAQGADLLAHELVHTVQQSSGGAAPQRKGTEVSESGDAAEREADTIARAALSGGQQMAPVERAAPIARRTETLSGNPNERTNSAGANRTTHRAPTLQDARNAPTAATAGNEAGEKNVKPVATEGDPLHLEPPVCPVTSLVYEEAETSEEPAPSGFTHITQINGTMTAPQVQQEADNSMFIDGTPTADDVQQSGIGDCYFLAATMSVVSRDPGKITSMIAPDGNGGGTVTFWRAQAHQPTLWERLFGGAPERDWIQVAVTVNNTLAFNISNNRVHGAQLRCADAPKASDYWAKTPGSNLEVHRKDIFECARWAPILEKAFARFAQTHGQYGGARPGGSSGGSGYDAINGGWSHRALCVYYGPEADNPDNNLGQDGITWTPGGNSITANPEAMERLILLQGRGSETREGETDAPIVTATAMVNPLIGRLAAAIPAAQGDADWVNVDPVRQTAVGTIATNIATWQALPNDPSPPAPQPKAAAKTAIGNACVQAVRPGLDESAGEQRKMDVMNSRVRRPIQFANDDDTVSAADTARMGRLNADLQRWTTPQVHVQIDGHASASGQEAHNLTLSTDRANNVEAAITAGGAVAPHTTGKTFHGESGATRDPSWRKVEVSLSPTGHRTNSLLDDARSGPIRAMTDLILDLRNIGTDSSTGQRNIYGNHVYSVVSINIVTTSGETVPLSAVPAQFRPLLYPLVDGDVSTVQLRNPHHGNEPDRRDNNTPTRAGDGPPSDSSSDGTFTMTLNEFFRNFTSVESGVFPRS